MEYSEKRTIRGTLLFQALAIRKGIDLKERPCSYHSVCMRKGYHVHWKVIEKGTFLSNMVFERVTKLI